MSRNALLQAQNGTDGRVKGGYHSGMNRNGPVQAPAPPQWQPAYAPAAPPPRGGRRWIPAAIISAGLIIAGVAVGGAVMLTSGNKAETSTTGQVGAAATVTESSTCTAWRPTKVALDAIPALPAGWGWATPNIDVYIANNSRAVEAALTPFEAKIAASDPEQVTKTAREYLAAKRAELSKLENRTYSTADGVPVNAAYATLNELCR
jgi:hypothetical protein